jgi:hypothetical protein
MPDELTELLDMAIYKEIASQAFYIAGQNKTQDPGARELMKELAEQELKHAERLKKLKEKGVGKGGWHQARVPDLRISEYLVGGETLEGAGLQDALLFALKREQHSVEFYSRMMSALREKPAKRLCQSLATEELRHKLRLELLYDDLFYGED